jgi:glycerol kinase
MFTRLDHLMICTSDLQQGIAQCVPLAVYRLPQADASLLGAAQLAAGMPCAVARTAEKIDISCPVPVLSGKYARWKDWLDGLLHNTPSGQGDRPFG